MRNLTQPVPSRRSARCLARRGADPQCRLGRRPEHGRLRQGLSRPDVREEPSRREGRLRRHRPRRCRLAEDLREARRPEGGAATTDFDVVVIHQKAAGTMVKESCSRNTPTGRHRKTGFQRDRQRIRSAPTSRATSSRCSTPRPHSPTTPTCSRSRRRQFRRAEGMGEEEPKTVRL